MTNTSRGPEGSSYSPDLAQAVGFVVVEASACEDKIGEFVVLARGLNLQEPDFEWWASGERLADAVSALGTEQAARVAEEYRSLLSLRHAIVHGLWFEGDGRHGVMLRGKSTKREPRPPSYDLYHGWSASSLKEVAERWLRLHDFVDGEITRLMGLE